MRRKLQILKETKQCLVPSDAGHADADESRACSMCMLMRHGCVVDDGIEDRPKSWKLFQGRFQSVDRLTVVNLVAQLARLQLEDSEYSFFIRGQELLTRL